jgi:FixJ family two-component response regulator
LDSVELRCEVFRTTKEFLNRELADEPSCLVLDVRLPGSSGLDFQRELTAAKINIPIIFISGHGDVPMTVKAMKAGAFGFFTKPFPEQEFLDTVHSALESDAARRERDHRRAELQERFEALSRRERQVLALVTAGLLNKQAAAEIGLSEVTIKVHRHNLMKKLGAKSLPDLVRMADVLGIRPNGEAMP